ncbi:hypothetical protein HHK36_001495 [Tetracentron sinense]|uniref:Uncharacterized protein n=1 Tax=Tetracentron sinense TaxID=13715 RepID=A0A834ZXC1_TETSI|nr:hypothetical protein HHK36_001495 [Tetracentron sinense]
MLMNGKNFPVREFSTPPPKWKSAPCSPMLLTEKKPSSSSSPPVRGDSFHVIHKVPAGDSPYVKAKQVQLIERDPSRAISLFWSAINSSDRVDSALKDMAIVMKQLNRADEAIEAIKSFRHRCSHQAQESLDNVLIDLYKRCGRIEEQIELLQKKLKLVEEGMTFGGRRTKVARSQGKKFHVSIEQERSRLLGNLAWAYMQQNKYQTAEELYKKALSLEMDNNKQCNLAICLMQRGRIAEAKSLLQSIRPSTDCNEADSYIKSFDRAFEMLTELESQSVLNPNEQKKEIGRDIQRSFMSPSNRNSKSLACSANGDQNGFVVCRRWEDRNDEEPGFLEVPVEKQKRGSYSQNQFENMADFSSFDKGRWGSDREIEEASTHNSRNTNGEAFVLPVSVNGNPKLTSLEPRSAWQSSQHPLFVDKWKKGAYFQSPFGRLSNSTDARKGRLVSEGIEEDSTCKKTYTNGRSQLTSTEPRNGSWSSINGYQRKMLRGDDAVKNQTVAVTMECQNLSAALPASNDANLRTPFQGPKSCGSSINGDWRRTSWEHDGPKKHEPENLNDNLRTPFQEPKSSPLSSIKGDWRRTSWEHDGPKKHEPENLSGDWDRRSKITVTGTPKWADISMDKSFRRKNTHEADTLLAPTTGNLKPTPDFSIFKGEKSWADMVEEDEAEFLTGLTNLSTEEQDYQSQELSVSFQTPSKWGDGWNGGEAFPDENVNSNIISPPPVNRNSSLKNQTENLRQNLEGVELKEQRYGRSMDAVSWRNPTVRRSLSFNRKQKPDSADYYCSSPLLNKPLDFEAYSCVSASGNESGSWKNSHRGNRLQVFRDITLLPDSPRA